MGFLNTYAKPCRPPLHEALERMGNKVFGQTLPASGAPPVSGAPPLRKVWLNPVNARKNRLLLADEAIVWDPPRRKNVDYPTVTELELEHLIEGMD